MIDRITLNELLVENLGSVQGVVEDLQDTDYELTGNEIREFIRKDPVLGPTWQNRLEKRKIVEAEAPNLRKLVMRKNPMTKAEQDAADAQFRLQSEQEFIAAEGLEQCGLSSELVGKAMSFAQFAGRSFSKMVDATHGMLLVEAMNLHERARYIREEILLNTEEEERVIIDKDGKANKVKMPKFTNEEKLLWQKELTALTAEIRKFADSATESEYTGHKIGQILKESQEPSKGGKRPKKLKRPKNVTPSPAKN